MNKLVIGIGLFLVLIIGVVGAYIILNDKSPTSTLGSNNNPVSVVSKVKACDVLTEDIAKSLLGNQIDHPSSDLANVETADISTTTCNYTTKVNLGNRDSNGIPKSDGLTMLLRVGKTQASADSNKVQFGSPSVRSQDVSGVGDKAYYSPDFHQLNVLKGGNWYVITYFKDTVANATLDTDKQFASKLKFQ